MKLIAKITGLLTRRRLVYSGSTLFLGLAAFLGYRFWGLQTQPPTLQSTNSPSEILASMTDDELRQFAEYQRLPESLQSDDWVRVEIIREALSQRLGQELVKRWTRDATGTSVTANYNTTAVHQVAKPVDNSLDVGQPGVLGVQVLAQPNGLQVTHVHPHSAASRCGLRTGDQIFAVNQTQVYSPQDLVQQLRRANVSDGQARIAFVRGYTRQLAIADVSGRGQHVASYWRDRF